MTRRRADSHPLGVPVHIAGTPGETCPGANSESCARASAEPVASLDRVKNSPLTIGVVIAAIVALTWVWGQVSAHSRHDDEVHQRLIQDHSASERAHPGIRSQIVKTEERLIKRIDRFERTVLRAVSSQQKGKQRQ
jgi:hypothetical protein